MNTCERDCVFFDVPCQVGARAHSCEGGGERLASPIGGRALLTLAARLLAHSSPPRTYAQIVRRCWGRVLQVLLTVALCIVGIRVAAWVVFTKGYFRKGARGGNCRGRGEGNDGTDAGAPTQIVVERIFTNPLVQMGAENGAAAVDASKSARAQP